MTEKQEYVDSKLVNKYINLFDSYTKSGIRRKTKNAINSATEAFVLDK